MLVHAPLYDFLKEHETGIARDGSTVRPYVHVPFLFMSEFARAVDIHLFDEHGLESTVCTDTVCIELADVFDAYEHPILNYAACFEQSDLDTYAGLLAKNKEEWSDR